MSQEKHIANQEILVEGNHDFHSVTEKIAGIVEMKNSRAWLIGFGISGLFFATSYSFDCVLALGRYCNLGTQ